LEEVSTTRGSGWVRSQARQMLHPLSLNFSILDQQDDLTFHVRTDQFVLYASSAKNQCIPGRTAPASRKTDYLTWMGVSLGPKLRTHPLPRMVLTVSKQDFEILRQSRTRSAMSGRTASSHQSHGSLRTRA
jgi:hypothetical protein